MGGKHALNTCVVIIFATLDAKMFSMKLCPKH